MCGKAARASASQQSSSASWRRRRTNQAVGHHQKATTTANSSQRTSASRRRRCVTSWAMMASSWAAGSRSTSDVGRRMVAVRPRRQTSGGVRLSVMQTLGEVARPAWAAKSWARCWRLSGACSARRTAAWKRATRRRATAARPAAPASQMAASHGRSRRPADWAPARCGWCVGRRFLELRRRAAPAGFAIVQREAAVVLLRGGMVRMLRRGEGRSFGMSPGRRRRRQAPRQPHRASRGGSLNLSLALLAGPSRHSPAEAAVTGGRRISGGRRATCRAGRMGSVWQGEAGLPRLRGGCP